MPRNSKAGGDMLQGTLDMLILRTLVLGAAHGHSIAHAIEHGSLFPALYRLGNRGWIASFSGTSENNRKAKFYRLTPSGRKQLRAETSRWDRLVTGIGQILRPVTEQLRCASFAAPSKMHRARGTSNSIWTPKRPAT